jgi:hypothetical protein
MQQFAEGDFQPIQYGALTVHPMFRAPIASGDRVRVTWISAMSPRVQGLSVRVRGTRLQQSCR